MEIQKTMENRLIIPRGNDFYLQISLFSELENGEYVPYELEQSPFISCYANSSLCEIKEVKNNTVIIDCKKLKVGCYNIELSFTNKERKCACRERNVFNISEFESNIFYEEYDPEIGRTFNMKFKLLPLFC